MQELVTGMAEILLTGRMSWSQVRIPTNGLVGSESTGEEERECGSPYAAWEI